VIPPEPQYQGYSPGVRDLLWPAAYEQRANEEGWTLRRASGFVEVDVYPPRSSDEPIYRELIMWVLVNAYVCGSAMHRIAWEFEYAANAQIYDDGYVPGDGMYRAMGVDDENGIPTWLLYDGSKGWP
jgi:hypothetical protein